MVLEFLVLVSGGLLIWRLNWMRFCRLRRGSRQGSSGGDDYLATLT